MQAGPPVDKELTGARPIGTMDSMESVHRGWETRGPGEPRQLRARWPIHGAVLAAVGVLLTACAGSPPAGTGSASAPVQFEAPRDTFAFANLVRAERPGRNDAFANYCIVMTRGANQFFRFARFAPAAPRVSPAEYTRLTREVLSRPAWEPPAPDDQRVVIPGYPDLHTLSAAQEAAVKAAFDSNILSMIHWRNWRVAVAFSPEHQEGVARELLAEIDAARPVTLMITNYPDEDLINHAVLVFDYRVPHDASGRRAGIEFKAYDPNDPGSPLEIHYDRATRAFWVAPLTYGPPGRIRAFRLYTSAFL